MTCILLVCDDEVLLSTRAALLRRTGAEVLPCKSHDALELQQRRTCGLVVLCHSVPEPMFACLAETIHNRWPATIRLYVVPQCDRRLADRDTPVDDTVSSDPCKLLARVTELLGKFPVVGSWSRASDKSADLSVDRL
ncbi:MAG: hypothetical protein NVS9B15_11150 [Acidobacteriaceae bacterium]